MSLPWFPYHIDKFLSDTLELDGPAVGAYHLLMLHYYATGKPPRDNDRVLATIARLPMDAWTERRPEIEALFQIRDGAWHHATIEAEMLAASFKHAAGIARASAMGKARWEKHPPKPAASKRQAVPQASSELAASMKSARSNAASTAPAQPEQCLADAQSTLTKESLSLVLDVAVEKDNSGDNSAEGFPQNSDEEGIGTPIDPMFWPCENHITVCTIDCVGELTIRAEVRKFIANHQERGTFSHNWDATWTKWWEHWRAYRDEKAAKEAKKAKPRVEVSSHYEPTWTEWSAACAKFAKNGSGSWSRHYGPEPGMGACRCPRRIMILAGIDPTTGFKMTPAAVDLALANLEPEKV